MELERNSIDPNQGQKDCHSVAPFSNKKRKKKKRHTLPQLFNYVLFVYVCVFVCIFMHKQFIKQLKACEPSFLMDHSIT